MVAHGVLSSADFVPTWRKSRQDEGTTLTWSMQNRHREGVSDREMGHFVPTAC